MTLDHSVWKRLHHYPPITSVGEAIEKLKFVAQFDSEVAHEEADQILCEVLFLLDHTVADLFHSLGVVNGKM